MTAPRNSTKDRAICIEAHKHRNAAGRWVLTCHVCKTDIDLLKDAASNGMSSWRADHIKRKAEGGPSTGENLWPICIDCDGGPGGKAARDNTEVAKGKRVSERHFGARVPDGRPIPGSKRSGWKKKMNGDVVRR